MSTTIGTLTERIMRRVEGGSASTRSRVGREEIKAEITSVLSAMFKAQVIETNFGFDADSIPDGLLIATFENIPVARRDRGKCQAQLPVAPMILPKGIGVYSVYPSGYPEQEYIPIRTGQINLLRADKMLNPLAAKTYSVSGNQVVIHSDIIGEGVHKLDMQLCAFDISHYGEYDPLPVPADMEEQCIIRVCQAFGIEVPIEKADNKAPSPQKSDL